MASNTMIKIPLMILLNYLILLICVVGFSGGAITALILPVLQIFLSWYNYHYSNKWQMVLILEINLLISTVVGLYLQGFLYLKFISNDAESVLILNLIIEAGIVIVLGLGIITTLLKYFFTKISRKALTKSE